MKGFKEPEDFGDDRDVVNKILVAALSHYGYPFDIAGGVKRKSGFVDPLYMLQHAPDLVPIFTIAAMIKNGKLDDEADGWMGRFTNGLLEILIRAHNSDELAKNQIKAIDKLIYPDTYELPRTVIEKLAKQYHTKAPLARGWRLREIIGNLSWVVEPVRKGASVLAGAILVRDKEKTSSHRIYIQSEKRERPAYDVAKKHWTRGVTLKTLAIRVYLEDLQQQGFEGIDERMLKRDLKEAESWEETLPKDQRDWGVVVVSPGRPPEHLPVGKYSEGWKQRKRSRMLSKDSDED